MSIEHNVITDPNIHEPKGVASATANKAYISNGAGSGTWKKITTSEMDSGAAGAGQIAVADGAGGVAYRNMPHGTIYFINMLSPYALVFPTFYAKVNPASLAGGSPSDFTEGTDSRLTYTGLPTQHFRIVCNVSISHSGGANCDILLKVYKNGLPIASSEVIETVINGNKANLIINSDVVLSTNDYIEVYAQNNGASGNVQFHSFYLSAFGVLEA